ncbi:MULTISPECIES: LysR family transcriptional regulator [unclassified Nocardioides]|uniref:LysR family transcriptional regulator n=1 Tax=unclassified Nocardioides TaxID=2615069 RepID=UPI000702A89F|nr:MULTISPECIES: LysR family transcriptional regulator [unclassified Nocardioides]KRC46652.1 LysR family transcriptional regulator [Nocardioides sp. Root79]KRC69998.1 LysR family transcriptional regulator [Nocardioides sp. Root240]
MLLRRLEYLAALAREGHFGRAAQACHVTQPALSAGILKLEKELGVQVVRRGQRFEGFTPEGLQVLEWAHRILAERAALDQTLAAMRGGLSGTLRIGAIPTALSVASLLTAPLRAEHPLVRFHLASMSSREIVQQLNDFEIDVGMTYVDGEPLGKVRVVPLYREHYVFLTPTDGPLGARDAVTWAEAAAAPLCLLTPDMQNRRIIDGHLADTGRTSNVVVETDTVSAIYAHLPAMGLSSIVPHTWLPAFGVPDGIRAVPLPKPRRRVHRVGLVLAGHGPESLLVRALVDVARGVDLAHGLDQSATTRSGAE